MLVDLTHPLWDGQPAFPGDPPLSVRAWGDLGSQGYNITAMSFSTHQGTHLDVPYHFFDDGKTLEQVPLDRFYGPARLVDLVPGGALAPRTPITEEMLRPHESAFQRGGRVICRTGWDRKFGQPEFFESYPSLTLDATRWIARHGICLLGMDTPSPSAAWNECHRILLGPDAQIVIIESLANLDRLPTQFTLIALPLALVGRDGSPIRAVAVVEPDAHSLDLQIVDEGQIDVALDRAARQLLCECFPPDVAVFSAGRAWNDVWPAFSVFARQGDSLVGQVGIIDRQITCGGVPVRVAGIGNMAVDAKWRGAGVSQKLMAVGMDEARRRGIRHGLLFCVPKLGDFYGRLGWRRVDRTIVMRDAAGKAGPLTAKNICMELILASESLPAGSIDLEGRDW